jgi:hypothetical protein
MMNRHETLVVLACLVIGSSAQADNASRATAVYLHRLQRDDGGFAQTDTPDARSSVAATSAALRALGQLGEKPKNRDACCKFLVSRWVKGVGFVDDPSTPTAKSVHLTSLGLMALVELGEPTAEYERSLPDVLSGRMSFEEIRIVAAMYEVLGKRPNRAAEWIETIRKQANADGTFGKGDGAAHETGSAVAALLRLGGALDAKQRDDVVRVLWDGQREDGGYGKDEVLGSNLESSYRVVRSLRMIGESVKQPEELRKFVVRCRNGDGGYGLEPGMKSSAVATYFAVMIQHWLK